MSRKQKVVSRLPSFKEWHTLGGYNFNGPGTKVLDRLSLNYKGKVGTESYFLPVNKVDRSAIQHDLLYYSPDNIARIFADGEYMTQVETTKFSRMKGINFLSEFFIRSQRELRITKEWALLGFTGTRIFSTLKKVLQILAVPPAKGSGSLMGYLLNPKKGKLSDFPRARKLMDFLFEIKGTRRGRQDKVRKEALIKFGQLILETALYIGIYKSEILREFRPLLNNLNDVYNTFKHSKRWLSLKSKNDNVMKKYDSYLSSIGSYDSNDDFVIKDNINQVMSKRKYVLFFKEYQKYINDVNVLYKNNPGFYPHEIPKLNYRNLEKVALPEMQKTKTIVLSPVVKQEIINQTKARDLV